MGLLEDFSSGLFIIQSVIFLIVLFVLYKFAWKPIMEAVNEREITIVDSLNQAKLARQQVENLKAENDIIIREAKVERDQILKEAREIKDRIVGEAKDAAKAEGDKMVEAGRLT
jgi:F-type H+-transporting ATPase subunit b